MSQDLTKNPPRLDPFIEQPATTADVVKDALARHAAKGSDNSDALLPCPNPWCADDCPKLSQRGGHLYFVICTGCGVKCNYEHSEASVIAAWNTRPPASDGEAVERAMKIAEAAHERLRPAGGKPWHHLDDYTRTLAVVAARDALAALPPSPASNGGAVREAAQHLLDVGEFCRTDDTESALRKLREALAQPSPASPTDVAGLTRDAGYAEAEQMLRDLIPVGQISDTAIRVARDHMMQFARRKLERLTSQPSPTGSEQ